MKQLRDDIGIETFGDNFFPIIRNGSALPVKWQNCFSTAHDNQTAIDLHFLFGSSDKASENHSLGKWRIEQIPQSGKAQTNITVTLEIDGKGTVNLSAELGGSPLIIRAMGEIAQAPIA